MEILPSFASNLAKSSTWKKLIEPARTGTFKFPRAELGYAPPALNVTAELTAAVFSTQTTNELILLAKASDILIPFRFF